MKNKIITVLKSFQMTKQKGNKKENETRKEILSAESY